MKPFGNIFGPPFRIELLLIVYLTFANAIVAMTAEQRTFWTKIKNFEIDDAQSTFSFSDRLARENGWSLEFALEVIEEYKKFMFLLCVAPHPLTPSDAVDQAWHLHLLYTESYWIDFCEETLHRKVHHGPTKGGAAEKNKFENWYSKTLLLYEQLFAQKPSPDIWPANEIRFSDIHFTRVNVKKNWIIRKPSFLSS
jgi:hypothetical protein